MLKNIVEYIVTALVEKPESVSIIQTNKDNRNVISITVASKDIGKVIGKDGKTIRAIRSLIEALGPHEMPFEIDISK